MRNFLLDKIFISGGYGSFHFGDDLMLASCLNYLKSRISADRIIVSSRDPAFTAKFHDIKTCRSLNAYFFVLFHRERTISSFTIDVMLFPFKLFWLAANVVFMKLRLPILCWSGDLSDLLMNIRDSKVLWLIGGGYYNSEYRFSSLFCKTLLIFMFKFLGKKVIMTGAGLFPFNWNIDRFIGKIALNLVDYLSVRDSCASNKMLKAFHINSHHSVSDDAIPYFESVAPLPASGRPGYIVVSLHGNGQVRKILHLIEKMFQFIKSKYKYKVIFMPHRENDREFYHKSLEAMAKKVEFEYEMFDVEKEGFAKMTDIIKGAVFTVGTRFHLAVASLAVSVPVIAIYYNKTYKNKFMGLMSQFNVEKYCISAEDLDNVHYLIDENVRVRPGFHERIRWRINEYSEKNKKGFDRALEMLGVAAPICDLCRTGSAESHINPAARSDILKCRDCGHIFTFPIPSENEILPASSQDPLTYRSSEEIERRNRSYYSYMLHELTSYIKGNKLLDIGCGYGHMLSVAKGKGFVVRGVEPQVLLAEHANRNGLNVYCGTLEKAAYPDASFDVVTIWEVLEHVASPSGTLNEIYRVIKKNGILSIVVPNVESKNAKTNPSWWKSYHFHHFSKKALLKYLSDTGFHIVSIIINPHINLKPSSNDKSRYFSGQALMIRIIRKCLSLPLLRGILKLTGEGSITVYARKK